jgi:hypothetical protein
MVEPKRCITRLTSGAICTMALVLSLFMLTTSVYATEGGGGVYPNGSEDCYSGCLPPPGLYFLNYVQYYRADKFKDNSGHDLKTPLGAKADFEVDAFANAARLVWVTKKTLFGGNVLSHLILPVVYQHVRFDLGPLGLNTQSKTGLGDITLGPFGIAWHSPNWHFVTGVDINMPTGSYSNGDLANISRNYWNIEPVVAVTYLTKNGFEASAKFMYDFNFVNADTHYLSGQEFHFDYFVGQKFANQWTVGATGYAYWQTTDDKWHGDKVRKTEFTPDGLTLQKGQVFAVGPLVRYDYKNMFFLLKYNFEMEAKNRPEGGKAWFRFLYAF